MSRPFLAYRLHNGWLAVYSPGLVAVAETGHLREAGRRVVPVRGGGRRVSPRSSFLLKVCEGLPARDSRAQTVRRVHVAPRVRAPLWLELL